MPRTVGGGRAGPQHRAAPPWCISGYLTYELADLPMFRELGDRLEPLARRRRHPAGQVLCTEGDPAGQLIA
ncbi:hypothetical protein AB0L05_29855, partial [Nonomuraea pusilla]|uniref:hypothetical protein n=1 Tax=Nonomuraea pusilla TaxID=46177 RepID=UPI003425D0A4